MIDAQAEAATRRGVRRRGVAVTFRRVSGVAPNTFTFSATVIAAVTDVAADAEAVARTGYGAREAGSIAQIDRRLIVMAADLAAKRFPLPIITSDTLVIEATGEAMTIARLDPYTRAMAGAVDIVAAAVA